MTFLLIGGIVVVVACAVACGLVLYTVRIVRKVEAELPPMGRFVDVPGARLHVVERGRGPAILMIHGLSGQLGHFTYGLVDLLAADHRVVAVDRPGSGYSVRMPGASAALGAQADVMASLIDALNLDRPLVVGHSLGGAVALALAQRHPQRAAGLALIAPLTRMPTSMSAVFDGIAISQPWMRKFIAWTLAVPITMIVRDRLLETVFGPEPVPDDFGTRGGALLGLRPTHFIAASTDLAAIPEDLPGMTERYGTMRIPVDVMYGRGDRLLSPAEQGDTLVAALPGARLTMVEGGHMLLITAPQATATFIRELAARTVSESPVSRT
jgi:pimeloyl-ACP methyl ester carboxylesterase